MTHRMLAAAALAVVLLLPGLAATQEPAVSRAAAERAIGLLRSPYCPGLMLEVCPSEPAQLLRDSIHDLARQGVAAGDIVEWMIERHGEEWRAVPKRSGAGLWAWIGPPAALFLGGIFLARRVQAMRAVVPALEGDGPEMDEAERAQLTAEMEAFEREEAEA
jgi:cytochrome c-type biogenesis protein CcmH/NrfF